MIERRDFLEFPDHQDDGRSLTDLVIPRTPTKFPKKFQQDLAVEPAKNKWFKDSDSPLSQQLQRETNGMPIRWRFSSNGRPSWRIRHIRVETFGGERESQMKENKGRMGEGILIEV